jgi:hypothetical protein
MTALMPRQRAREASVSGVAKVLAHFFLGCTVANVRGYPQHGDGTASLSSFAVSAAHALASTEYAYAQ